MWIVRLALRRPYTFVVMSLMIVILGILATFRMPTDIFPEIDIPVVSVIWSYAGISPEEMAEVVTIRCERSFTTSVNDIEHMESQSLPGLSIIKVFFHAGAKVDAAVAQLAAASQAVLHSLPTGMTPPSILRYNASSVPILQMSISSDTMSESSLYDYGYNFIRTQMATVQGASFPLPYGGRPRQIMVDIDLKSLYAQGLSANDVVNAVNAQSLIIPSGIAKIGPNEFVVRLNSLPPSADAFNSLPIKQTNGTTIYIRDVGHVRDGYAIQSNIVRHNGNRATLLTVLKNGGSSTLSIVAKIKEILPRIRSTLPAASESEAAVRSIHLRARRYQWRAQGSGHRRLPHRPHDPALPGKLALHHHRLHLHPALDSHLARRHEPAGRNHQRHDPRRSGPGRRHPGGRRHCRNRKHPSQHGPAQAHHQGHPGWRVANRRSRVCFHLVYLHRLRARDLPERRRPLPVHAPGAGGGARHHGVVYPLAHPRTDHGQVPAARRGRPLPGRVRRNGRRRPRLLRLASTTASKRASNARATLTGACSAPRWRIANWWPHASG
jgi:hypothetical protein